MATSPHPGGPDPARLLAIGAAVAFMGIALSFIVPILRQSRAPAHPLAPVPGLSPEPIPEEALVFRIRPGDVAAPVGDSVDRGAQPRTLAIYRRLRAYPGAPPRVPHGVSDREFRETRCNSCHQRGGFVPRFGTYAPVTPHPEFASCLQCHPVDAMSVGIPLPDGSMALTCSQCHVDPDRPPPSLVSLDWVPRAWPHVPDPTPKGTPPAIPHELQLRGNCLACHGGPGAVREIRTTHPERTNCRQCHVSVAPDVLPFSRLLDPLRVGSGGEP